METTLKKELSEDIASDPEAIDVNNMKECEDATNSDISSTTSKIKLTSNELISDEYFDKFKEDVKEMNFIEISSACKDITTEIENLKSAHAAIESIKNLDLSGINKNIVEANAVSEFNMNKDIEEFEKEYDINLIKMNNLLEIATARKAEFDDVDKTTSFLSNLMLEMINKRMTTQNSLYLKVLKSVYSDPSSVDFIVDKAKQFKPNLSRIKKNIKENKSTVKNIQSKVKKEFDLYNEAQMSAYEEWLRINVFDNNDTNTFYFIYAMSSIYTNLKNFKKNGTHKWIEISISIVLNIVVGMYDLEGGEEFYISQLKKVKQALGL